MSWKLLGTVLVSISLVGCTGSGGDGKATGGAETSGASSAASTAGTAALKPLPSTPPNMTGEAPKPDLSKLTLPEGVDAALVELGRQVWMGKEAGGTCYTCHGMDAKGSMLAPDQTDAAFLHGDGSFEAILEIVKKGVPAGELKQAAAPMPPMGGAQLDERHAKAVAAYIYAISHTGS